MKNNPGDNRYYSSDWRSEDCQMMALALKLAKKGEYTARPNPMVGCVIVANGEVVGRGWHQKFGLPHAEVNALKQAAQNARGATCYVTLEPCAHTGKTGPCAEALVKAGIKRVVSAMQDPNPDVSGKGFDILSQAGIQVEYGLMQEQAIALNRGFVSRFNRKKPWVTCKLAMSLDGRTALADGSSQWITGSAARSDVQKLRACQDAIMTGIGTCIADDPSLNVRAQDCAIELDDWFVRAEKLGFSQPARILLDRKARAETNRKIFRSDANVFWVTEKPQNSKGFQQSERLFESSNHEVLSIEYPNTLSQLMKFFAELGMNHIMLESGHKLAGSFLQEGLIDELVIYMAPKLMGANAKALFEINVTEMNNTPELMLTDVRQLGDDIRLVYQPLS